LAKAKFTNKKTLNAQEQYEQALAKLKAARSKLNRISQEEEAKVAQQIGERVMELYHLESTDQVRQWLAKLPVVMPPETNSFENETSTPTETFRPDAGDSKTDSNQNY
jgi:hypothetical protein